MKKRVAMLLIDETQQYDVNIIKILPKKLIIALTYRVPKTVKEYILHEDTIYGDTIYPICPTCEASLCIDYQRFCVACGQRLKWSIKNMQIKQKP